MLENLPYFQRHLPEDLSRVNEVINQAVQSDVALISQIGTYIISAGGKRLRPIMTILAGKSVGYDGDKLYALAAMVEFIHTSTLLHDDVVDESDLRRGRETANNLFGNAAAQHFQTTPRLKRSSEKSFRLTAGSSSSDTCGFYEAGIH